MEVFEDAAVSEGDSADHDINIVFGVNAVSHQRSHVCSFIRIKYATGVSSEIAAQLTTIPNQAPVTKTTQIDYEPVSADIVSKYPRLEETGVSFETLIRMLERESEVRLGEDVQQRYLTRGYQHYVDITLEAQRAVAVEFGFTAEEGVHLLQSAEYLVASDPDKLERVRNASFYRKYNRCYDGSVRVGDVVNETQHPLWRLTRSETNEQFAAGWNPNNCSLTPESLSATLQRSAGSDHKPTVIVAGSYS